MGWAGGKEEEQQLDRIVGSACSGYGILPQFHTKGTIVENGTVYSIHSTYRTCLLPNNRPVAGGLGWRVGNESESTHTERTSARRRKNHTINGPCRDRWGGTHASLDFSFSGLGLGDMGRESWRRGYPCFLRGGQLSVRSKDWGDQQGSMTMPRAIPHSPSRLVAWGERREGRDGSLTAKRVFFGQPRS